MAPLNPSFYFLLVESYQSARNKTVLLYIYCSCGGMETIQWYSLISWIKFLTKPDPPNAILIQDIVPLIVCHYCHSSNSFPFNQLDRDTHAYYVIIMKRIENHIENSKKYHWFITISSPSFWVWSDADLTDHSCRCYLVHQILSIHQLISIVVHYRISQLSSAAM
jgi:hypothetical protein